jgi:UDP-N-acetylglucosamine:LPS N-acetylglucosamine transferase
MASAHITVVSASIGAGHDGAAREIERRLTGLGYDVRHFDFLDLLPGRMGPAIRRTYATELALAPRTWGWLLGALEHGRAASATSALACRVATARALSALQSGPSVVVSTYPLASQVLGQLRGSGQLAAPVVTFLTDMSVHPLWVAPGVDLHLALHEVPAGQAARHGARVRVAGAAVDPAFHPYWTYAERSATRALHGIPADRPAALVVGGSLGVGDVEATMRDIAASGVAVPVAVCGANTRLRNRIQRSGSGLALGWVHDMAPLMRACDVVIQNAGGLTSLEAIACGVPVVSYRCLAGHGLTNTKALQEAGLAAWARDRGELRGALENAVSMARQARPAVTMADDPARVVAALAGPPVRYAIPPAPATGGTALLPSRQPAVT